MILVDSSVWIDHFNDHRTPQTAKLFAEPEEILVGDFILLEVLRGARDDIHSARLERELRRFDVEPLLDAHLAVKAAENYRRLRALGFTTRKSIDVIIGTFCIERGHVLLHDDRDFAPMEKHLELKVL